MTQRGFHTPKSGMIQWMTKHRVAANLLMWFILIGGLLTAFIIKQEIFPEFDVDVIMISVPYPGASPEEVEKGIILAAEEAVRPIQGVKRVNSTASEGMATVSIQLRTGTNSQKALQDVKNAIDRIPNLPEEAERPNIRLLEHTLNVMSLVLYGDVDYASLHHLAEKTRDELLLKPEVNTVSIDGARPPEISVEVPQETLRRYGLTLQGMAARIRNHSRDFAGGGIKTPGGEILLRVHERREHGSQFDSIPIVTAADGTVVRLGNIARVKDTFAETDEASYFNGKPAMMISIGSESEKKPLVVANAVKKYIEEELKPSLPTSVKVKVVDDFSQHYRERINLLLRNGLIGLILVLILLGLFLDVKLGFWVTMGIPVSFLGTILLLPHVGVSINMISLFAFIMALGIVVDDAIVVGENIYSWREKRNFIDAAIMGAREMAIPVLYAVLTNIVAFIPLFFVEGVMGKVFKVVPSVVCLAFTISLLEAIFILPAHLAWSKVKRVHSQSQISSKIGAIQKKVSTTLESFIYNRYKPLLIKALENRWFTVSIALSVLILTIGYLAGGRMEFAFSPKAEADEVTVALMLPYGSPVEKTMTIQEQLVKAAQRTAEKLGGTYLLEGIFSHIGTSQAFDRVNANLIEGGHAANIRVFLVPADQRDFTGDHFGALWRKEMGAIPGVDSITFQVREMGPPAGRPIDIQLRHPDENVLESAAVELAENLKTYSAARDIDDGVHLGKPQYNFKLTAEAAAMGFQASDIATQVRSAFYGAEAFRFQRGRYEVKVMVRLPEQARRRQHSIEKMVVRNRLGKEMWLKDAVRFTSDRAYTSINRVDGARVVDVSADVQPRSEKSGILSDVAKKYIPALVKKYPGLSYSLEGEQRETSESMNSLAINFVLAIIAIFVLLGIAFRSYAQPLIVMISIPFGMIGAVIGHLIMGFNLSVVSMLGLTALSGVVVNDALILIDFANEQRKKGTPVFPAVVEAGVRRFRPILLTTLTTFFGLTPMIFETSFQARILVPMAISLGYGILFATLINLLLVPCLYLIIEGRGSTHSSKEANIQPAERELITQMD